MRLASRALYRSRQFFGSVRPRVDESLREQAFALLNDGQRQLFTSMTARDQQHCLDVYSALREQGHDDGDLLVAALLHDAGKGEIELWHRVAYVLLAAPGSVLVDLIAKPSEGTGWRQALYRCHHHPMLGALLAAAAGSSKKVVDLIGERHDDDVRLAALKAADESV